MAMTEKTRMVYDYLVENDGQNHTSEDIANALGMTKKSVDGVITQGLWKKGLAERVVAQIEVEEDGVKKYKDIKLIQLTQAGREFDPDASEVASETKEE